MSTAKHIAPTLADQLRLAITKSGLSQYSLAKQSGVSQSKISEFLSGKDMLLTSAGKLAAVLKLKLQGPKKRT